MRTIIGRVVDSKTHEPVKYANVIVFGTRSGGNSNALGFFKMELAEGYDELVISHIGYETGKVHIPQEDNFTVMLTPSVKSLNKLELSYIPKQSDSAYQTSQQSSKLNTVERDAEYVRGMENFYNEFGNNIVNDSSFIRNNFSLSLAFRVTKNGEIDNIQISPDSAINKDAIRNALLHMETWKPAIQQGYPVNERFLIPISLDSSFEYFKIVDTPAMPEGGYEAFYKFIAKNLKYPAQARNLGVEGKVYVQFVVLKDGSFTDIQIVKGIGAGCDEEVERVMRLAPKWNPPKVEGKPVKQRIILPITFSLGEHNFKVSSNDIATFDINVNPQFPGGDKQLNKYVEEHKREVKEPVPPNEHGDAVYLSFVVNTDGKLDSIIVTKGLSKSFNAEAIRLCANMPNWTPGKKNDEAIRSNAFVKIYFGTISASKIIAANNSFKKGVSLYNNGKLEKALVNFSKAIEDHPSRLDFYFNRAIVNIKLNKIESACQDLQFIKEFDQEALDLYNQYCKTSN